MSRSINVNLYTMTDNGIPYDKACRMLNMIAVHLPPFHTQVYKPVILRGKATTSMRIMRTWKLDSLDRLCEDRLLNPRRSPIDNWIDLKRVINALKIKENNVKL